MDREDLDILLIMILCLLCVSILVAAVITYPTFFLVLTAVYSAYLLNHFFPGFIRKYLGLE